MEESPKQQPLEPTGKATPDPNTDFGNEAFDYTSIPQKRLSAGGLNEWIFGLMRPKSKLSAKPVKATAPIPLVHEVKSYQASPDAPIFVQDSPRSFSVPPGYTAQNGLLIKKKTIVERARDQMKFPVLKNTQSIINGAALILFAAGAYILYSELPTRPELVVGILIVSISANIIISNR
jgi:hypothetical protein